MGDNMKCIKIIKYANDGNVVKVEKLVNRKIREKAERILQRKAEKYYNSLFK